MDTFWRVGGIVAYVIAALFLLSIAALPGLLFARVRWAQRYDEWLKRRWAGEPRWTPQHMHPSPHATHAHFSIPSPAPSSVPRTVMTPMDLPGPLANYALDADGTVRQFRAGVERVQGWGHAGVLPMLQGEPLPVDLDLDNPSERTKTWVEQAEDLVREHNPIGKALEAMGWRDTGMESPPGHHIYEPIVANPPGHYQILSGRQGGKATLRRAAQIHQLPRFHDPLGPIKWNPKFREWNYVVRSYRDGAFDLETVHKGDASLLMEIDAIQRVGNECDVWRVSSRDGSLYPLSSVRRP